MDKSSPLETEMVMMFLPSSQCLRLFLPLVLLVVVVACITQDACTHHTGGDLLLQLALAASLLLVRDVGAVGQVLNLVLPQSALVVAVGDVIAITLVLSIRSHDVAGGSKLTETSEISRWADSVVRIPRTKK
jgi:hypothetical protein